jgi:hypothetical protein
MFAFSWLRQLQRRWFPRRPIRRVPVRQVRLGLEVLEDRTLLSGGLPYATATNSSQLAADITAANANGGPNTITLGATIQLTSVDNSTNGDNGLPVIAAGDQLTIVGNGFSIERSTAAGTPAFRLFDVASGGSLTLENVMLSGGLAYGTGAAAEGGAIYNSGNLTLRSVTVMTNRAVGSNGGSASGGGLYVAGGTVTLSNDTFSSNQINGGTGHKGNNGGSGGDGSGGGLYVAGGTVTLNNDTLSRDGAGGGLGSSASGGANGPSGGDGSGGGLYVAAGTVTLDNNTLSSNTAIGGTGGPAGTGGRAGTGGVGSGGGLYVAGGTVTLSNETLSGNNAKGGRGGYALTSHSGGPPGLGGNGGGGSGGGLYVAGGTVTLGNDTLSGNDAHGGFGEGGVEGAKVGDGGNGTGGGLYLVSGSTTLLTNTVIAQNTVAGGGSEDQLGSNGSASDPDVSGTVTSSDHDFIGDGTGSNLQNDNGVNGDQVGTAAHPLNPLLGPLQNNGGPTQTMAPLSGSPLIDAGDSSASGLPSTDQRGYARIVGNAIDIGAVEYQYDLAVSGTASSTVVAGQKITYQISVINNGPDTAGNGGGIVLTDVLPSGVSLVSLTPPSGWTTANQNGTVTATTASLASGASASFTLVVQTSNSTPTSVANTVTIGPSIWDTDTSNNSVDFTTAVQYQPTIRVTDAGGTYNGSPFPATATASGVNDTTVSGSFTYTYYVGSGTSGTSLGATPPTNAGTYTVVAAFTSNDPNYTNGTAQITFTIGKATPTVFVTDMGGTYNGSAFSATATITGVNGQAADSLEGVTPTSTYYAGSNASGTPLTSAPSNAGTYTVVASFAGSSDYSSASAQTAFTIKPLAATLSGTRTFDGTTTAAAGILSITNVINGDQLLLSGSATLASANVGSETISSFAGLTLGGTAAGNYTLNGASGSVNITPATPMLTVSDGGTYNGNPFPASATAVGVDGTMPVNGNFTFTYYSGPTASGTPLSSPPSNAGTYTVVATFNSSDPNYLNNSTQTTFTINAASTTTVVSPAAVPFNDSAQSVTLKATVTSGGGGVPEGTVTFTVLQGGTLLGTATSTSSFDSNGNVSVNYDLPAGLAAGSYTIDAVYNPGNDFAASSDTTHTLTITAAAAAIQFTNVTRVPNLLALNQTETITVHVSGPGVVNQGTVTFRVDGQSINAAVDGNGDATASLTLPLLTAAFPQNISAAFNGPNRSSAATTQSVFWNVADILMPAVATFAAEGGQSVQSYFIGLPLLDFLYTGQGQLTEVVFGPGLLSCDFSYSGALTVIRLDGVLPVALIVNTPQGPLMLPLSS